MSDFKKELQILINRFSKENGSNTPDFILAEYLISCLENFNKTVMCRQKWYAPYPGQNDVFDVGTSNGTAKDIVDVFDNSAMFCDHANEMPAKCSCGGGCYCKRNTCLP
ncbi:MAG: hypothetical protein AABY22_09405, partial [Nanoarchaeota archaeon]